MDIWDRFRSEAKSQSQFQVDFIVTGDSRAGKTAVISRFLDTAPPSKPTVALEYLYARKGDTLCNIIEIGGELNTSSRDLCQIPLASSVCDSLCLCLVLDLSRPARFEDISKRFSKLVEQERRKKDTELHVILVGNKYDKFSSEPNEKKRVINNFLRALAVTLRGSLVQASHNSESLMLKVRKLLNYTIFASGQLPKNELDVNSALLVTKDNWDALGIRSLEKAVVDLNKVIPQERVLSGTNRKRNETAEFVEAGIDNAVEQYRNFTTFKPLLQS